MYFIRKKLIFTWQKNYFISENWARSYSPILTKNNSTFLANYSAYIIFRKKINSIEPLMVDMNRYELILRLKQYIVSILYIAFNSRLFGHMNIIFSIAFKYNMYM